MTLDQYIAANGMTNAAFAELIEVDQSTVYRMRQPNGQVPSRDIMVRIFAATGGKVTPNDFFGVSA